MRASSGLLLLLAFLVATAKPPHTHAQARSPSPYPGWADEQDKLRYEEWMRRYGWNNPWGVSNLFDPIEAEDKRVPIEQWSPCYDARQRRSNAPCPAVDRIWICPDEIMCKMFKRQ